MANKAKDKAKDPRRAKAVPKVAPSPKQEAAALEARAAELRKPKPIEFPKAVRFKDQERIFETRAAQDAAGPDWAD